VLRSYTGFATFASTLPLNSFSGNTAGHSKPNSWYKTPSPELSLAGGNTCFNFCDVPWYKTYGACKTWGSGTITGTCGADEGLLPRV
jgi:hypothetical protein